MKIEIKKDFSTLGKSYIATFSAFNANGETKDKAKENILSVLEWFTNNSIYPQTIIKQLPEANRTIILERSAIGYKVIISYQNDEKGYNQNESYYGYINHSEALERLESHINGYSVAAV